MREISFTDDHFDYKITSSYFISIQISLDGFYFCTLDPVKNRYIQFENHLLSKDAKKNQESIEELFNKKEKLNLPYKKTFILIPGLTNTLVPSGLYKTNKPEEWLKLSYGNINLKENIVVSNKVNLADAYNVFTIPKKLHTIISRQFPSPQIFHQHTPIIEKNLSTRMTNHGSTILYINLEDSFFDIIAFKNNKLQLSNSFIIKSKQDFIYFALFVFEQLKLERAQTKIILSGRHSGFNTLQKELKRYIKNIYTTKLPYEFQYSYHFRDLKNTAFHNMLSLPLCE
ncbi:DUF3822 family protein [Marinilabiliaceae bacterium ANBcel2]|nr:DUF3822 family protein [Marinilabiliaceae bacterium ANBcel2]